MLGTAVLPWRGSLAFPPRPRATEYALRSATAQAALGGSVHPPVDVWAFNAMVPGPTLRVRQGSRIRVVVDNALAEPTTVHWHGVRVPNAMDGVPHVTQAPIGQGGRFIYDFEPADAGTFWYHPHIRSEELRRPWPLRASDHRRA